MRLYLIGSLRNPKVPIIAKILRDQGHEVFDEWYAAGPEADDYWMHYEHARGHSFAEALAGYPAEHVFRYDKHHLDRCEGAVLVLPTGKSGHLELGYMIGQRKPGFILLDKEPERFDVMYRFASGIASDAFGLLFAISEWEKENAKRSERERLAPASEDAVRLLWGDYGAPKMERPNVRPMRDGEERTESSDNR